MILTNRFFLSRLGRRIFFMFVACALLPLAIISLFSIRQVTAQLREQSLIELKLRCESQALIIHEHLLILENTLKTTGRFWKESLASSPEGDRDKLQNQVENRFRTIFIFNRETPPISIFGSADIQPQELLKLIGNLKSEKTTIITKPVKNGVADIFMIRLFDHENSDTGGLIGQVDPNFIFNPKLQELLPWAIRMAILDQDQQIIFSTFSPDTIFSDLSRVGLGRNHSGNFETVFAQQKNIAVYLSLFLEGHFSGSSWIVMLSKSRQEVLSPVKSFLTLSCLIFVATLLLITLFSVKFIQKSLIPLERLHEGTRQIIKHNFSHQIKVSGQDEFSDLAEAFNLMSTELQRQFKALVSKSEIDRAVLSSLERDEIIKTVINRTEDFLSCESVGIIMINDDNDSRYQTYISTAQKTVKEISLSLKEIDLETLQACKTFLLFQSSEKFPPFFSTLGVKPKEQVLIFPISISDRLVAAMFFIYHDFDKYFQEELVLAQQMMEQVGVALANSDLLSDLQEMNWGSLMAFSRSVDAKSPWTAGHSSRVTHLALEIARIMGLTEHEYDNIHRAALLHDIGKIGISIELLDKPGTLNPQEVSLIQAHPEIGARILEPIKAFREFIPAILEHHERFDGKGYPAGKKGKEICLEARIIAVADVFDACTYDRPYRTGMEHDKAVTIIEEEAGSNFDPEVVAAFLKVDFLQLQLKNSSQGLL